LALGAFLLLSFSSSLQAASLERWVYCAQNLWVDKNIEDLEALLRRAAKAGYTHVLLTDSKFGKLGDMDARYFTNIARVKQIAAELKLEIVPAEWRAWPVSQPARSSGAEVSSQPRGLPGTSVWSNQTV
jgi:hypothetical protein